jgi:hypothetical protein
VGGAVRILRRSTHAVPSAPVITTNAEKIMVVEDFRRLCSYMTALTTQQIPADVRAMTKAEKENGHKVTEQWMLWRETRVLAERCITNLSEIRRALGDRDTLTTDRVGKLDGAQEALSDLIGSISNPQLPGWPTAPQHTGRAADSPKEQFNSEQATYFDRASLTIRRFTDWLNSASSELTPAIPKPKPGAAFRAVTESDPEAKAAPAAPASSQRASPAINGKPAMSKKAKALAALADHPDWTDEQIAQAAGCHVKSLYRWEDFVRARELLREARADAMKGSKDAKTGHVDAWDDETPDDDNE